MKHNQLRIIGGKWRGRKLAFPNIEGLRPTPNRVRETLFNWLSPVIHGSRCLDLFAGSGVLGFEALSRGANEVTFVDHQQSAIAQLKTNRQILNCELAKIYHMTADQYLLQAAQPFDIIFLDPPFHQNLVQPICKTISEKSLLRPKAYIYIEAESRLEAFDLPNHWEILKQKQAGQVFYHLVRFTI